MEKNIRLLSIHDEVEKYGTQSVDTIELIAEITGAKIGIINEMVWENGTIQKALINATCEKNKVTKMQAYKLKLLGELLKRNTSCPEEDVVNMNSPRIIADFYMQEFRHLEVEHFDILLLTTKNTVIKKVNISKGTVNASIVHPRDVFREAMKLNASGIVLMHNHPSGDPTPSNEDIDITNRLIDVGGVVGIKVLDHIIFGNNRFISLKEKNLI